MYPVHKQTEIGTKIAFYYFFKSQNLVRTFMKIQMFFDSVPFWLQTVMNIWQFSFTKVFQYGLL